LRRRGTLRGRKLGERGLEKPPEKERGKPYPCGEGRIALTNGWPNQRKGWRGQGGEKGCGKKRRAQELG